MADYSPEVRSRVMARIRPRDTEPEMAIRRRLHGMGLRYRVGKRLVLPGGAVRPDIVFTRSRVAVFVDGCFWHVCPEHGTFPKRNADFWHEKLHKNVQRDELHNSILIGAGWLPIHVWEHEDAMGAAERIAAVVAQSS